jgi:superfamily II DNA or RNA helicase
MEFTAKINWTAEELQSLSRAHQLKRGGRIVGLDLWTKPRERLVIDGAQVHLELDVGKGFQRLTELDALVPEWCCLDRIVYRVSEDAFEFERPQLCDGARLKRWKQEWEIVGDWQEPCHPVAELLHPQGHLLRAYLRFASGHRPLMGTGHEQDLLSLGFGRRGSGGEYGLDGGQPSEALELLASAGWDITLRGRPIVVQTGHQLALGVGGKLTGQIEFGQTQVALEQAWGSRDSLLCELPGGWGLLQPSSLRGCLRRSEEGFKLPPSAASESLLCGVKITAEGHNWLGRDVPRQPSSDFLGVLRPYQLEGMRWILQMAARGAGGLLADEMGLGKTVQVIAALSQLPSSSLIVVPLSLLENWRREWTRFCPTRPVLVHHGSSRSKEDPFDEHVQHSAPIVLTTPSLVRTDRWLRERSWGAVVVDEAHLLKNHEALTTQAMRELRAGLRVLITGTPLENRPEELWTHLSFLDPELAGDRQSFVTLFGQDIGRKALQASWQGWMRRRRKVEVAPDLPPVIEQELMLSCSPEQLALLEQIRRAEPLAEPEVDPMAEEEQERQDPILVRLTRMRQVCCSPQLVGHPGESPKLLQLQQDLEECLAEGRQAVVFSQFVGMLQLARRGFSGHSGLLTGKTKDRQELVDAFQRGECPVLFCSLKAAGVGLNLQRADLVILLEPWWNRAAQQQAIDRAHRIGRATPVLVKRYLMVGTLEEKMRDLQMRKEAMAQAWWEKPSSAMDWRHVEELLELG